MEYTFEAWLKCKEALNLTNKAIAEIIGTTEDNVRKQLGPEKKMPTWARSMIFVHSRQIPEFAPERPVLTDDLQGLKSVIAINKKTGKPVGAIDMDKLSESLNNNEPGKKLNRVMFPAGGIVTGELERLSKSCSCYLDDKGLFRRGKGSTCNLPKEKHNFNNLNSAL